MPSLADISGSHDLKIRCLACENTATLDTEVVEQRLRAKGLPLDLETLAERFRCTLCGAKQSQVEPVLIPLEGEVTADSVVGAIYHGNRAKTGKRRNEGGYGLDGGRRTMGRWWK